MTCDEVRELAPAYALGALSADEARALEVHLAECDLHQELAGLRATARLLQRTAPEREPPPALRERILAAATTDAVPPQQLPVREPRQPRALSRGGAPWAMAAALAVIAVGLLAWNLALLRGGDEGGPSIVRTSSEGPVSTLRYVEDGELAVLTVQGLEPAPDGHVYQVWVIRDGTPRPDALFDAPRSGEARAAVAASLRQGDVVAVTVEPDGGSTAPSGTPFLLIPI